MQRETRMRGKQMRFACERGGALVVRARNYCEPACGNFAPYKRHQRFAQQLERQKIRQMTE
jgi:hypothetical protein